jgi:hypothetical protein
MIGKMSPNLALNPRQNFALHPVQNQWPWFSRNFSASRAAMQPEPAAVMAWR